MMGVINNKVPIQKMQNVLRRQWVVSNQVSKQWYIKKYDKRQVLDVQENAYRLSGAAARTGRIKYKKKKNRHIRDYKDSSIKNTIIRK